MSKNYCLILAGGEICMTYDDRKFSASPGVSVAELESWILPHLAQDLDIIDWTRLQGSHLTLRLTADLIEMAARQIQNGCQGVTLVTGNDTLEEVAYFAEQIWTYPQPLVFATAKQPHGALGSDAIASINEALQVSRSREAWGCGVLICSQGEIFSVNDLVEDSNSGRSGLFSSPSGPLGEVLDENVIIWNRPQGSRKFDVETKPARYVEMLEATMGGGEWCIEHLATRNELQGLIIAGFGGGNIHPSWVPHVKKLLREDIPVVIVSRRISGRTTLYSTGEGSFSKMFDMGVLDGGDLTPRRARIKLAIGLGAGLQKTELQEYLLHN